LDSKGKFYSLQLFFYFSDKLFDSIESYYFFEIKTWRGILWKNQRNRL